MAIKETWFHVIPQDKSPAWGFAVGEAGTITKSAVTEILWKKPSEIRNYFLTNKLKVYKILINERSI